MEDISMDIDDFINNYYLFDSTVTEDLGSKINEKIGTIKAFESEFLVNFNELKVLREFSDHNMLVSGNMISNASQMMCQFETIISYENGLKLLFHEIFGNEFEKWKKFQKFQGDVNPEDLNAIKNWVNNYFDAISKLKENLDKFLDQLIVVADKLNLLYQEYIETNNIENLIQSQISQLLQIHGNCKELKNQLEKMYLEVIKYSFFVSKQPSQILKQGNQIKTELQSLIEKPRIPISDITIHFTIVNESQANDLQVSWAQNQHLNVDSGKISNNHTTIKIDKNTTILAADFDKQKSTLTKVKRGDKNAKTGIKSEKRQKKFVTDELFFLNFEINYKIQNVEQISRILSAPFVVILSGNQTADAWGTISCFNYFANLGKNVPENDVVGWEDLKKIFNFPFQKLGKSLSEENFTYLAQILGIELQNSSGAGCFNLSKLSEKKFGPKKSFWEWFYSILKLTEEFLLEPWRNGSIIGFISRQNTMDILSSPGIPFGTFILRFSETLLGQITIFYLDYNSQVECLSFSVEILKLQPFSYYLHNPMNKLTYVYSAKDGLLVHILEGFPKVDKDDEASSSPNENSKNKGGYAKMKMFMTNLLK